MGLIHPNGLNCSRGTCTLRCGEGAMIAGLRKTHCKRDKRTKEWSWNRTLGTCITCDELNPVSNDQNMTSNCQLRTSKYFVCLLQSSLF